MYNCLSRTSPFPSMEHHEKEVASLHHTFPTPSLAFTTQDSLKDSAKFFRNSNTRSIYIYIRRHRGASARHAVAMEAERDCLAVGRRIAVPRLAGHSTQGDRPRATRSPPAQCPLQARPRVPKCLDSEHISPQRVHAVRYETLHLELLVVLEA